MSSVHVGNLCPPPIQDYDASKNCLLYRALCHYDRQDGHCWHVALAHCISSCRCLPICVVLGPLYGTRPDCACVGDAYTPIAQGFTKARACYLNGVHSNSPGALRRLTSSSDGLEQRAYGQLYSCARASMRTSTQAGASLARSIAVSIELGCEYPVSVSVSAVFPCTM